MAHKIRLFTVLAGTALLTIAIAGTSLATTSTVASHATAPRPAATTSLDKVGSRDANGSVDKVDHTVTTSSTAVTTSTATVDKSVDTHQAENRSVDLAGDTEAGKAPVEKSSTDTTTGNGIAQGNSVDKNPSNR
jgi:hypothetical protein